MARPAVERLFHEIFNIGAGAAWQALRGGANVIAVCFLVLTFLLEACRDGFDEAAANARARDRSLNSSAILGACYQGHLFLVRVLINHDNGLLEIVDNLGYTPLLQAIRGRHSDIVRFLLDCGADPHHANEAGATALMYACVVGRLDIVRLLLDDGVDVDARDARQQTALHHAAAGGSIEVVRELILQCRANMFAVDRYGLTPFDWACRREQAADVVSPLLEVYGNKLSQDHGSIALHKLLQVAEFSFAEDDGFHPPLNPLRIILPLGKLTLKHFSTLLHTLDPALIRNRDDTGKLPIHVACQTNAPVEVLALILELDPTTLHTADFTGALPIHLLCGTLSATEYTSVRYLVEQGGVGTLAARSRRGLMPLHVLCRSTNAPLRAVQYLIQSFPGSVAMRTNAGQYPFMMAAAGNSASASLSVIYVLVQAIHGLVVPG